MKARPLSPHLQVYRPQLTSVLSILHRMTGVALAVGALLFGVWVAAAVFYAPIFTLLGQFFKHWLGHIFLIGWAWALYYHLCNGIRHLFWDVGRGFALKDVYLSGWLVVVASAAMTAVSWVLGAKIWAQGGIAVMGG